MSYTLGKTLSEIVWKDATHANDGETRIVVDSFGDKMLFQHNVSSATPTTGGGYVTVEFSLDEGNTWFTPDSTFGTQPSAIKQANYGFHLKPVSDYVRLTLHVTDGTHSVFVQGMG